jgi:hypothetical protein
MPWDLGCIGRYVCTTDKIIMQKRKNTKTQKRKPVCTRVIVLVLYVRTVALYMVYVSTVKSKNRER